MSRKLFLCFCWVILAASVTGLGWVVYHAGMWVFFEVARLYKASGTEFRLGLLTAILTTTGVVWSVIYQRRREVEQLQFEKKYEAYGYFFDMLFDVVDKNRRNTAYDPLSDENFVRQWRDMTKKMMIWGSSKTISAYNDFQRADSNGGALATTARVEALMRRFRADLGHKDRRLKKFALSKLLIKGDEHHFLD